jgi:uncharacterized protein YjbI with pentapeptide repeats
VYLSLYYQRLWESISCLPAIFPDGTPVNKKTYPWLFNDMAVLYSPLLKEHRPPLHKVQSVILYFLIWLVVPLTLVAFWIGFVSAKSYWTILHINLTSVTFASAWWSYQMMVTAFRTARAGRGAEDAYNRRVELMRSTGVVVLLSLSVLWASTIHVFPSRPNFAGANAERWNLRDENFRSADFTGANLAHSNLFRAQLGESVLRDSDLRGADLEGAELEFASLDGARLSGSRWVNARLFGTDFRGAVGLCPDSVKTGVLWRYAIYDDSTQAILRVSESYARAVRLKDLRGIDSLMELCSADLSGVSFNDWDLDSVILNGTNLQGADLGSSSLVDARLRRANLSGANLTKADLRWADLSWADLARANLEEAHLNNADVSSARLYGADLRTAKGVTERMVRVSKWDHTTKWPKHLSFRISQWEEITLEQLLKQAEKEDR